MKEILATFLCAALVSPAFASVDMRLTAEDGSNLILLPTGTTAAWITLRLELTKPNPPVGITGFNAALQVNSIQGNGQFRIVSREVGKDATGVTLPDAKYISAGIDPDTGDEYDRVVGSILSPKSLDVGLYKGSGFWAADKFPATMSIFALELTGIQSGDMYELTVGDPGTGIIVADNATPIPNAIPVGKVGFVLVFQPEPASALLLACGGLFLRRRRV